VDDPGGVGDGERPGDLRADPRELLGWLRLAGERPQGHAVDQLHGDEAPRLGLADLVDGENVRVVQR
jgi:hypothetical protein